MKLYIAGVIEPAPPKMLSGTQGSFVGPSILGKGDRRFVYAQIPGMPLRLSVDAPAAAVDIAWLVKAAAIASAILGLLAITVISTRLRPRNSN